MRAEIVKIEKNFIVDRMMWVTAMWRKRLPGQKGKGGYFAENTENRMKKKK